MYVMNIKVYFFRFRDLRNGTTCLPSHNEESILDGLFRLVYKSQHSSGTSLKTWTIFKYSSRTGPKLEFVRNAEVHYHKMILSMQ